MSWMERAACRGVDPEWFFPLPGDHEGVVRAARVCFGCPVKAECREHAVSTPERFGVWAGECREQPHPSRGCKNGHAWTPENTVWRYSSSGSRFRSCRECSRFGGVRAREMQKKEKV